MGLEMYLYGANWTHEKGTRPSTMELIEVAYWRKQTAIHNWMVKNVQEGVNNCALYCLTETHLKTLLRDCDKVLADPTIENVMALLPPVDECYFGGTDLNRDYDHDYYLDGVKYTVMRIEDILKNREFETYFYCAIW